MSKNIIYCICSYLEEEQAELKNIIKSANSIPEWANRNNIDCEFITKIPHNIEDMVETIKDKWWPTRRKSKKFLKVLHKLKAWNTKYEIIHKFYNSNYEKMIYIDCDFLPRLDASGKYKNKLDFDKIQTGYYMDIRNRPLNKEIKPPISTVEKYSNQKLKYRYIAGIMYLTKDFKHNMKNIFNYDKIYKLWETDLDFIREETSLNYILFNENIARDITPINKHTKFLKHIGGKSKKNNFIYNNEWGC